MKQVSLLQEELKLQETHFKRELSVQLEHASVLTNSSLLNDNKFVDMMTKLNEEQRKYFKEKTFIENNVKVNTDMARQKVKELENELEKQQQYFDTQI